LFDVAKQGDRPFYDSVLATIPLRRMGTRDEFADAVVSLASSRAPELPVPASASMVGQHKPN
jgi:NAD(P)-dependent dehydrogenase (short-subunit alcohol dehydrogenase family)